MDFPRLIISAVTLSIILFILRLFLRRTLRTAKIKRWWQTIADRFHEHQSLRVPEFFDENDPQQQNDLYHRVSLYLNSLTSLEDADLTNLLSASSKPTDISLSLSPDQTISDEFLDARLSWIHRIPSGGTGLGKESCGRAFLLRIRKRDKRRILRPYLQHIHTVSEEQIEQQRRRREIRLFTNVAGNDSDYPKGKSLWTSVPFTHPATMDTVVMDTEVKAKIRSDLETFVKSRQYYTRLGRAWRRSYLLYGPSGTGKSSFVAAMAKLLKYDVYDVNLSRVCSDSDLKVLLLQTSPRSLILLEDFDRFITRITNRNNSNPNPNATSPANYGNSSWISGVLNFMDGVVSSCCEERVMVFTMTMKDNIDPIVLRPGRVDVHIRFNRCDFNSFKNLASSHLGVRDHKLFPQVQEMFTGGATLSPAEIGELMAVNRNSPSRALKSVISALQNTSRAGLSPAAGEGLELAKNDRRENIGSRSSVDSSGSVGGKDSGKEFRKFYGLLRRKSGREIEPLDVES